LGAGAVVLVGTGLAIRKIRHATRLPPGGGGVSPVPGGGGLGPKLNYIPHLTNWPHRDRYGNEHAFGVQLQSWGYPVGELNTDPEWSIIDAPGLVAVESFQRDFNLVRQIELPPPAAPPPLKADGLIGPDTASAVWLGEQWSLAMNLTWPDLVELAQGELGIA